MDNDKSVQAYFGYILTTAYTGSGSVSPSGPQVADQPVLVTASPSTGWRFNQWSGDLTGSTNPKNLTMDAPKSVTAEFIKTYNLTTSKIGNGTMSPSSGTYDTGNLASITATPDPGWRFSQMQVGNFYYNDNPVTIIMDSDKNVIGHFIERKTLVLQASPTSGGAVSANPTGGTYDINTVVNVTATPADVNYWRFDHFSDGVNNYTSNPLPVTMDDDKIVTANFVEVRRLWTSVQGNGTISPAPPVHIYDKGIDVPVSATPDSGWGFSHWTQSLSGSINPTVITMSGDRSVTAVFLPLHALTVSVSPSNSGSVTADPDTSPYLEGSQVVLTATPAAGWRFDRWEGDVTDTTNPLTVTMDNEKTVQAVFIKTWTLTTAPVGSGQIVIDGTGGTPDGTYDTGQDLNLRAIPAAGWRFDRWEVGAVTDTSNPLTVTMDADKTVQAVFIKTWTLTTISNPHSQIVINGTTNQPDGIYDDGTVLYINVIPQYGWRFEQWSGDASGASLPLIITISADTTIGVDLVELSRVIDSVIGEGTIQRDPLQDFYEPNTSITYTAIPAPGWSFADWQGSLASANAQETLTVNGTHLVTAVFQRNTFPLTTSVVGQGNISSLCFGSLT